MRFSYDPAVRERFPELASRAFEIDLAGTPGAVDGLVGPHLAAALARLAAGAEGEFAEIQAWRRAFARMGLKPTQYRCASEALLRRLRKEGALPALNPLVDICNAVSCAFATPIAAVDMDRIAGAVIVRPATGDELYETFAGDVEHPEAGEIIFADADNRAHARRWTNRQSGFSAVGPRTRHVLVVVEAMHAGADADLDRLAADLATAVRHCWPGVSVREVQPGIG